MEKFSPVSSSKNRRNVARALVMAAAVIATSWPTNTFAQVRGQTPLPRQEHYMALGQVYQGEYENAARQYKSLSRGAYKDANGFFLDSICYWTMLAESLYHTGQYAEALKLYDDALALYLSFQTWPTRTQFPQQIQTNPPNKTAKINWATSSRKTVIGVYDKMLIQMGRMDADQALRDGGVFDPARLRTVDVAEVLRCAALCLHRRQCILGPMSKYNATSKELSTSLTAGGAGIAGAWQGVLKGIAQASMEDWPNAVNTLTRSLQVNNNYDHPLTPVALLQLGMAAEAQEQWDAALQMYVEASLSAGVFNQYDLVEESLRRASNIFAMNKQNVGFEPLAGASAWAKREGANPIQASMTVQAAMAAAEASDFQSAEDLLMQARREMGRTDLTESPVMTRWYYVTALAAYAKGDTKNGDEAVSDFLRMSGKNSLRLFQMASADDFVRSGGATEMDADQLYSVVLAEPTDGQWLIDPMESLAYTAANQVEMLERWFEVARSRKAEEKAIQIAERIRRERFFSALPLGGRLMGLRWVLEAPESTLTDKARAQKQELNIRYPAYKDLSTQAESLRVALEELPIAPEDQSPEKQQQRDLLEQLAVAVDAQERSLRQIALLREPCEMSFPPPLDLAAIQERLSPRQMIVSFINVGANYHVMLINNNRYAFENVIRSNNLNRKVATLLKDIGLGDKSAVFEPEIFQNEEWKTTAREITEMIFVNADPKTISSLDEIIVIPDGALWYMPMELLQYGTPEDAINVNEKVKIRYAPLVSLAVPDDRVAKRFPRAAMVVDRNFTKDDSAMMEQGFEAFQADIPDVTRVDKTMQGPSNLIAGVIDQLFVWQESKDPSRSNLFSFSPFQFDHGTPGSSVDSWMMLPWRGIDQVVFAGFSSNAEGSGRSRANGQELFITSCAMMASGTRTLLISRWRVGGQTTLDLTREFALLLKDHSASDALQRSVQLLGESEININAESRVRDGNLAEPIKADHPFFWAGYMLLDTGWDPNSSDEVTSSEDDTSTDTDENDDGN